LILEGAPLNVRRGQAAAFELAFAEAQKIIFSLPGRVSPELRRCTEREDRSSCRTSERVDP
jgi:hypothetical protein